MDTSGSCILCNVVIECLNSSHETVRKQSLRKCEMTLWRNEHKELVLGVQGAKTKQNIKKYVIRDLKFHCNYLKEGKVSITLLNQNVRFLISNCPPENLKNFCKILAVKLSNEKAKGEMSLRKKILLGLPKVLEEISPLNEKDIAKVNERNSTKENVGTAASKPVQRENFVNRKRKLSSNCLATTNQVKSIEKRLSKECVRENEEENVESNSSKRRLIKLPTEKLNPEQKKVLVAIKSKMNIFFTGSAGTGKSFLLKYIVGMLPPAHTFVTASTGVAACQIGGMTLHSFAGLGKATGTIQNCINFVMSRPSVLKQWKKCHHLIIDEISMIDGDFFDKLETIARVAKQNTEPFGGIQLILCGDFFQLPPVSKGTERKKLCFQSASWVKCISKCIELRQVYRQSDPKFVRLLQDIRIGRCTDASTAVLQNTSTNKLEKSGILATKLCTHRDDVDYMNQSHLDELPSVSCTYQCEDNAAAYSTVLDQALPDTRKIFLKLGAQVMLTKNLDVTSGLVNGARGVITGFTNSLNPSMRIPKYQLIGSSQPQNVGLPIVRFLAGMERTITHERWSLKISQDCVAVRKQIPLKLAWAISIHKSQGMSLDSVEMCLSRVFECGQAYVALSRARSLCGLKVVDFTPSCVRSNIDAIRFYRNLRREQLNDSCTELIPLER